MKKIIGAAAAGLVLTGAAFADASISVNTRIGGDLFGYTSPTRQDQKKDTDNDGTDVTGKAYFARLRQTSDDVKVQVNGEKGGAFITFNVNSEFSKDGWTSIDYSASTKDTALVNTKYYWLWMDFGNLRLSAGENDVRLGKAINYDGNWQANLSGSQKPGIWKTFGITGNEKKWADDATNIGVLREKLTFVNVQAQYKVSDALTVYGALFFDKNAQNYTGTAQGDKETHDDGSNPWTFAPFALGAVYNLDKNSQIAVVGKMVYNQPVKDDKTPQQSVWYLSADYYNKLNSNLEIEGTYTFGAALATDIGMFNHGQGFVSSTGYKAQDYDVFAHGFDFRAKGRAGLIQYTGIVGVNYVQSSEMTRRSIRGVAAKDKNYEDRRALSYGEKAAGELGYYATVGLGYSLNDTVTLQFHTKVEDDNLFSAYKGDGNRIEVDYWDGLKLTMRPGVLLTASKNVELNTGLMLVVDGFHAHATGGNNTVKTAWTIPFTMRVRL